jgi:Zn-dependent protease
MPSFSSGELAIGFLMFCAFLFSTTCHEAAHALVAKLGGDETAARGGQVTLNPIPHVQREPFGMVVVPILSFLFFRGMIGYASAPFDPDWERRHPHRSAWMALAGPAANFSLMLFAAALLRAGWSFDWFTPSVQTGGPGFAETILFVFFSLNLLLGVFNLLPAPPLDGSTVIMLFMSENTAKRYLDWLRGNSYALLGLLLAYLVFERIYGPIQRFLTVLLLYGGR